MSRYDTEDITAMREKYANELWRPRVKGKRKK
jgi:hypothetical protein